MQLSAQLSTSNCFVASKFANMTSYRVNKNLYYNKLSSFQSLNNTPNAMHLYHRDFKNTPSQSRESTSTKSWIWTLISGQNGIFVAPLHVWSGAFLEGDNTQTEITCFCLLTGAHSEKDQWPDENIHALASLSYLFIRCYSENSRWADAFKPSWKSSSERWRN